MNKTEALENESMEDSAHRAADLLSEDKLPPAKDLAPSRSRDTLAVADQRAAIPSKFTPLFPSDDLQELRGRWKEVQTAFVDEPRSAVEQADQLVASAMKRLAEVFAHERSKLEKQWDGGSDVSTEDLRLALQRYREFFQRLLAV
jgi:hypothetical protein